MFYAPAPWQCCLSTGVLFKYVRSLNGFDFGEDQFNPQCANRNKSRLLSSPAKMFKKPLWQAVWAQIRLLL